MAVVTIVYAVVFFLLSYVDGLFEHMLAPYGRLDLFPFADQILGDR